MNKRLLTLALAVVTTMVAVPAMAQDNFPDVPENHWAYEAIENLKREGILVGYPDGTYKGPRATTRYELAVALNAAYQRLKNITDGLAEQIAEIRRNMGTGGDKGLADRLAAVEGQIRGMGSMADDMAAMKRMADEFQKELAGLGVDVEAMKKDIDSMKKMMGMKEPMPVTISGDANIVMHAGAADNDRSEPDPQKRGFGGFGIYGIDGRIVGWDEDRNRETGSILGDLNVYHEIAVNLAGNAGGTKWDATMVYTNLFGSGPSFGSTTGGSFVTQGYGNQSGRFQGTAFGEGAGDVYIQRLAVDLSSSLPFKALVGRIGNSTDSPYFFKRADNTPYFENERWDDGHFTMDGAKFSFDFGSNSNLTIFAGRNDKRQSTNGTEISPITLGSIGAGGGFSDNFAVVQNTLGSQLKFGLGDKGAVSLAYLWHGLTAFGEGATPGDRLETLGADANFTLNDQIGLKAGYGQTTLKFRGSNVVDNDNTAYWASLDYKGSAFGVNVGYRNIEENYLAPGDWERLGTFFSPRGIKDFQAGVNFNAGQNLAIMARGIFGEFQNGGPDYNSIKADASFGFGGGWNAMVGYEQFTIDGGSGTDPRQRWISAGVRRNLGSGLFKLMYQYGDHTIGSPLALRGFSEERVKGHILFGQVTVKF